MRDAVANPPVKEKDVCLPSYLYKEHKGDRQEQDISPHAIFNPVASTGDNGWVSSTTPLSKPGKKTLIFGSNNFTNCKDDNYPPLVLLLSLQDLGFEIYIKHEKGISALPNTIDGIMGLLETKAPTSTEDYTTLAEEHQVARDDTLMLDEGQTKEIYEAFFSKRVGAQKADYTDPVYATQILYKIASHDTVMKVMGYCEEKERHEGFDTSHVVNLFFCAAVAHGDLKAVKFFIKEKKADVNQENDSGFMPLHLACENGHLEVAKWLVDEKEVDVNQKNKLGDTPLQLACLHGHMELAKWLVDEKEVSVNQTDGDGRTLLHLACFKGHVELVKWLVDEKKIDVNRTDKHGNTPFLWLCNNGHMKLIKFLFKKNNINIDQKNKAGCTPLCAACRSGNVELAKWLVGNGADVNQKNKHGDTPLHWACENGHKELAKWLVGNGANTDVKNNRGWRPLDLLPKSINPIEISQPISCSKKPPISNGIYIASGGESNAMKPEVSKDTTHYRMKPFGKVLNIKDTDTAIRTRLCYYKDITTSLEYDQPIIQFSRVDKVCDLSKETINGCKEVDPNTCTYYKFNLQAQKGQRIRLLSADPNEELLGIRLRNKEGNNSPFTLERGSDDFYYLTAQEDGAISYVVGVTAETTSLYQNIDPTHPLKMLIEEFSRKQASEDLPDYKEEQHSEWMEYCYNHKAGVCRHFAAAMLFKVTKDLPEEYKDKIRVVCIDNDHEQVEIKVDGKWVFCPTLGGGGKYKITYEDMDKKKEDKITIKQNKPSDTWQQKIRFQEMPKEGELFKNVTTEEALVHGTINSNAKRILVTGKKDQLRPIANTLIQQGCMEKRDMFYIDGPGAIDIGNKTLRFDEGTPIISETGHLEHYLEHCGEKPSLIVNWPKFTAQEKVQCNTLIDEKSSLCGKKFPKSIQVISLDTPIGKEESQSKSDYLSRHPQKLHAQGNFTKTVPLMEGKETTIDLQGFPDWRSHLFGALVVKDNVIHWKKSDFVKALEEANDEKREIDETLPVFNIINIAPGQAQALMQEWQQAKAFGKFNYHGYNIPLPEGVGLNISENPFDFKQFAESSDITIGCRVGEAPPSAVVINSHLFDQLLHGKQIEDGKYSTSPGLIEQASNGKLALYITSPLSETQWYAALFTAKQHGVRLQVYTALSNKDIPSGLITKQNNELVIRENVKFPRIIATNDCRQALEKHYDENALVIHVEDYNSLDLWYGTPKDAGYNLKERRYHDGFSLTESPIRQALQDGRKVILAGEFSHSLLEHLAPVLAGKGKGLENLTFLIEHKEIGKETKQLPQFNWLPKDVCQIKHYTPSKGKEPVIWEEEAPTKTEEVNLDHCEEKTNEFIDTRIGKLREMFAQSAMVQLVGPAAVGKSSLMKLYKEHTKVELFYGMAALKQWAAYPKDSGDAILVIDEANIDNSHYTMFETLKSKTGKRELLFQGELIQVPEYCKISFLMNPSKDKEGQHYGGGRKEQKLFKEGIPQMHFEAFPPEYVYQEILKKPVYDQLDEETKRHITENAFKEKCQKILSGYVKGTKTPRDLQEQMLRFVAPKEELEELEAPRFISTLATAKAQSTLETCLSIRQRQYQQNTTTTAIGKPGVLIKGEPGVGKTAMIREVLKARGIPKAKNLEELKQSKEQSYIKIDASLSLAQKKALIIEAFDQGHFVWIDEVNSCIDKGLEKILNLTMTGEHPVTGKPATHPGFGVIASINSAAQEGRAIIGKALKSRFNHADMPNFKQYDGQSFEKVMKHLNIKTTSTGFLNNPRIMNFRDMKNMGISYGNQFSLI